MRTNRLALFVFLMLVVVLVFQYGAGEGSPTDKLESGLDVLAKLAATGGLLGLLYQFKRDRDLAEANFVVSLNGSFITNDHITRIYEMLEASKAEDQKDDPFSGSDIIDMANYLSFFGPFWGLIDRGVVKIEMIDILAYRFFLGTNNRFMQEKLLCRLGKEMAWRNIYLLHKAWSAYRHDRGLPVWQEEFDLSKSPVYSDITDGIS